MGSQSNSGLPRSVEVLVGAFALCVVAPLLCVAAIAIVATAGRPIFFRHQRAGRGGKPFMLLKFRTMHVNTHGPEVTAKADPRITAVGRLLRKTKIDELPELWNVVRGDMSLVGPRPEALPYVDLSNPMWAEALRVRPGITDPTTLRLRNEEELLNASGADPEAFYRQYLVPYKLRGYRDYLRGRTWRQDVAVLKLTVLAVIFPRRTPPPAPADIISSVESTHPGAVAVGRRRQHAANCLSEG